MIEGNLSCFNVSVRPQPAAVAAVSALAATVPHIEPWSHLLFFLSGNGDITINGNVTAVKSGTVCQVRAGEQHSLRNLGGGDMLVLTIYDPPRARRRG